MASVVQARSDAVVKSFEAFELAAAVDFPAERFEGKRVGVADPVDQDKTAFTPWGEGINEVPDIHVTDHDVTVEDLFQEDVQPGAGGGVESTGCDEGAEVRGEVAFGIPGGLCDKAEAEVGLGESDHLL